MINVRLRFTCGFQCKHTLHTPSKCIETWNLFVCNIYSVYGFFLYQYTNYTLQLVPFLKIPHCSAFNVFVCIQNTLQHKCIGCCWCCRFIFVNSLTSVQSESVHIHTLYTKRMNGKYMQSQYQYANT